MLRILLIVALRSSRLRYGTSFAARAKGDLREDLQIPLSAAVGDD